MMKVKEWIRAFAGTTGGGNRVTGGSVLLFSLVVMGMVTLLTQQLIKSVSVGIFFSSSMVKREQAEMLALGGINVAIASLQKGLEPKKQRGVQDDKQKQRAGGFPFATFIQNVVPHLGRWQKFALTEEYDGVDGEVEVCITCEAGKIPTSQLFDAKKKDLSSLSTALFKQFGMKKIIATGGMAAQLKALYKKHPAPLRDVTQLACVAEHFSLPLFYEPQPYVAPGAKRRSSDDERVRPIALQDLFTTWRSAKQISPLFMTDAACAVIGVRRPQPTDSFKRVDRYKQLAQQFETLRKKKGEELFKGLQLLFDSKPKLSKELMGFFSLEIEPRFYSVLSCATVGGVKQVILAILEQVADHKAGDTGKKQGQSSKKSKEKKKRPHFVIRRLYWV